jgi:KDO2-lipid IV(A) lauroyltransferase
MLTDFLLMGSLAPKDVIARVTVDGRERLDQALARGRGAIMALPHMGSWDMAGSYAGALGYRVLAVAERFPGSLNDEVVRTRQKFGMSVVMLGRSAVHAMISALESNGVVALVCDLEQGPGVPVRFFGRRAIVPSGPAAFALKTGAPLIPVKVTAVGPSRYHVHIDEQMTWGPEATKEGLMQEVIERFEGFIREQPDQWYAFRPIFKD